MADLVTIPRRFNGPPDSAHGGYACGVVAAAIGGDGAQVSLRLPPPLGVPLRRTRDAGGRVTLEHEGRLVAEGAPDEPAVTPPPAPSVAEAQAAGTRYAGFKEHVFPTCVVCGPARGEDGFGIFAGPLDGPGGMVACTWRPDAGLAADGAVESEAVWAALDCPSAFACTWAGPAVLARLTARIVAPVAPGLEHVVVAWPVARDGRKHRAGSAIHTAEGELVAFAEALWIEVKDPRSFGAGG